MDNENCWKLYCHTNLTNNKKYVGKTSEENVEDRWGNGGCKYKPKNKNSSHFWNSICKYTWDGFKHEILKDNLTESEVNYWEKYYIKKWDLMNPDKGYNEKEGGEGGKWSKNMRNKVSQKIVCITTKERFDSIMEASEKYNISYKQINKVCNRTRFSTHGLRFCYAKDYNKDLINAVKEKRIYKKIICIETKEIFDSCADAGRKTNINSKSINSNCLNKTKSAGNLHFCYLEDYNPNKKYILKTGNQLRAKSIICLETMEIFASIKECSMVMNLDSTNINKVCKGKIKSTKGYTFRYYNEDKYFYG